MKDTLTDNLQYAALFIFVYSRLQIYPNEVFKYNMEFRPDDMVLKIVKFKKIENCHS